MKDKGGWRLGVHVCHLSVFTSLSPHVDRQRYWVKMRVWGPESPWRPDSSTPEYHL